MVVHPALAACLLALTVTTVYLGRKSAKMPTETYEPTARLHIKLALATIAVVCVVVVLGPFLVDEAGLDPFETPHAVVGVAAASLWVVQGGLGWLLWNDKEKVRKFHRANGWLVLGLALLQVPSGLYNAFEYLSYYGFP